jgi:hypothetical protein
MAEGQAAQGFVRNLFLSGQTRPGGVAGREGNQPPVNSLYPAFANTGFLEMFLH